MSVIKPIFTSALLFFCAVGFAQFTDVINSNRPGKSMAAFSVGKTVIQAELGANVYKEDYYNDFDNYTNDYKGDGWQYDAAVRYGAFFEQLEFIGQLEYQAEHYSQINTIYRKSRSLKNATIGAKFLIYDPVKNYEAKPNLYSWKANHKFSWRQFIPAVGVYGGLNFDMSNNKFLRPGTLANKKMSFKLMALTQHQFGRFVLVSNIFLNRFPEKRNIDYIVTLTRGFNPRWSGFIEGQAYNSENYGAVFRIGAAYLAYENIQIDGSIGTNIQNNPSLVVGGIGVSWRFDDNYQDVYLRIPKEKKSKEDKKKDKKKEKAKKRLDAIENGEKVKE